MSYGFTKEILIDLHFKKSLTTGEIAKEYGCHRDTVRLALKRFGLTPKGKMRKPISDNLRSQLIYYYIEQRLSTRQIGDILNLSHDCVSEKLKEIGIQVDDRITALSSDRNPCWNGGKSTKDGYVTISSKYHNGFGHGEHRIVMEEFIGRPLQPNEVVHHIDRDRSNNHIDNLALMTVSAHARLHNLERWNKNA